MLFRSVSQSRYGIANDDPNTTRETFGSEDDEQSESGSDNESTTDENTVVSGDDESVESEETSPEIRRRRKMENLVYTARNQDPGVELTKALEEYLDGNNINNGRINAINFPIIQDNSDAESITLHNSIKGSGFDENFKTAKFAHGAKPSLRDIDARLGIDEDNDATFRKGFAHSRIRTHEYIHTGKGSKETNSHIGGLYNKKLRQELSSNRTSGSKDFHDRRQIYIEGVIEEVTDLIDNKNKLNTEIEGFKKEITSNQKTLEKIKKDGSRKLS